MAKGKRNDTGRRERSALAEPVSIVRVDENARGLHFDMLHADCGNVRALLDFDGTNLNGTLRFETVPGMKTINDVINAALRQFDRDLIDAVQFHIETPGGAMPDWRWTIVGEPLGEGLDEEMQEEWIHPDIPNELVMQADGELRLDVAGQDRDSVFYDVVDENDDRLAEAIFDYSAERVSIAVHLLVPPSVSLKHRIVHLLSEAAMSGDDTAIRLKMQYEGQSLGGYYAQREERYSPI